MTWQPYALSLGAGLLAGVLYGLINVRSPAPPVIALVGLLGILIGESAVQYMRGHTGVLARALHLKSFAHSESAALPPEVSTPLRKPPGPEA